MADRLIDAEIWWSTNPKVSSVFRDRVEKHGLHKALDMTTGFDWRSYESNFPPRSAA